MIDLTVPEAIRFRSSNFSVTKELRCPVCGGKVQYRSWDPVHEYFAYHCTYCGHDTQITWAAAAVLRAKGEVKFDEDGDPIIPEDVEIPDLPDDPDNSAYEVWAIMQEAEAASGDGGDTPSTPVASDKFTVTITGSGCTINGATATNKQVQANKNADYEFTVVPTNADIDIIVDDKIDFTKLGVQIDGNVVSESNKRGLTWTVNEANNSVKFTLANITANHTIIVSSVDDDI